MIFFGSRVLCIVIASIVLAPGLLGSSQLFAAPAVFWASDPVRPAQAVQVVGADLESIDRVDVVRLADEAGNSKSAATPVAAEILGKSATGLTFVLPADFEPGVFSVTLYGSAGLTSFQLNAPDIYWIQGDQGQAAGPGGWLRVSGRNIALGDAALLRLTSSKGDVVDLTADRGDIWSAQFAVPATLPPDHYQAALWNGRGDRTAWRAGGSVAIAAVSRQQGPVLSLRAVPPGKSGDDAPRINAALRGLANQGGGTVMLQPGTYWLEGSIRMPKNTVLKGASPTLVSLIWRDSETPPDAMIVGESEFSIETLTINSGRHYDIIRGGLDEELQPLLNARGIVIRAVTVRASAYLGHLTPDERERRRRDIQQHVKDGAAAIRLSGADLTVENCDIASSTRSLVLIRPRAARLSGNVFRNGANGWYGISGPDGVLIENNRFIGADLQASGGGISTLDGWNSARNVLFRGNRFEAIYGADREALTSDGPGGFFQGQVSVPSNGDVRLGEGRFGNLAGQSWAGAGLFVLSGKSAGAVFQVLRRNGDSVALDGDPIAEVGDGDRVTIVPMQENYLVVANTFEDTGVAQIYGTGYNHVFASNRFVRSEGVSLVAKEYKQGRGGLQPNFDIQILENNVLGPGLQAVSGISILARQPSGNETMLSHGIVVRGNTLLSGADIRLDGDDEKASAISGVLVEGNHIAHNPVGISILTGVENLQLRNNRTEDVARGVVRPSD